MAADGISCSRRNAWGRGSDVRKKETGGKADRFVLAADGGCGRLGCPAGDAAGGDRVPQALGALAFCAAFAGGLPAGKGRLGPGGSLLNAGAFALLLILLCFGGWGEGIAVRGLILLALILLGGLLAALLCGKVGKRSNKRLVKSHKKLRSV